MHQTLPSGSWVTNSRLLQLGRLLCELLKLRGFGIPHWGGETEGQIKAYGSAALSKRIYPAGDPGKYHGQRAPSGVSMMRKQAAVPLCGIRIEPG